MKKPPTPKKELSKAQSCLVKLSPEAFPQFHDSEDIFLLKESIQNNFNYLNKLQEHDVFYYGQDSYTVKEVKESFQLFLDLVAQHGKNPQEFNLAIQRHFNVYQSQGSDNTGTVLYTGYFIPKVKGDTKPSKRFSCPIYGLPPDRILINLGEFRPKYEGQKMVGKLVGNKIVPYYTRKEIERGALKDYGCEIAWIENPIDLYFIQLQGSGVIELPNKTLLFLGYAGTNGHPYTSIAHAIRQHTTNKEAVGSMQMMKKFLHEHKHVTKDILNHDQSFVFFQKNNQVAIGSIGVRLKGKRSIATDSELFPKGSLMFVSTKKPIVDPKGQIKNWDSMNVFVVNQDTGGAIRGPGRADFFWGHDRYAEIAAGHMKHPGKLFILIKKR